MLRSLLRRLRWPLIASAATFLILVTSSALAGSGLGAYFNLGKTNSVNRTSLLTGTTSSAQLKVTNASTATTAIGITGQSASATGAGVDGINLAGGPGLQADVSPGTPPIQVNSTAQVPNLNASLLGGNGPSYYLPGSAVQRIGPVAVPADNSSHPLFTFGQLTFIGRCLSQHNPQGAEQVAIDIESSANHAAWSDTTAGPYAPATHVDEDLLAGTPETLVRSDSMDSGTSFFSYATGAAVSPDGHEVFFNLYLSQNAQGATGDNCVFGGSFIAP